jgi:exodeoxyribonuclease V alpha subunit
MFRYNRGMSETLIGLIERVTFHNADTGFAVLRVQADRRQALVTVVGHVASAVAGEYVEAGGNWVQDKDHGLQFKADQLRTTPPHTVEGIEKYLASGLIKGIGKHFARKIVQAFGARTLAVIDESPAFLREIKGVGPQRIQRIRESWRQQKAVRAIMVFLQSHGVGTARAVRIYKTYGDQAIERVREDPYRLATDIWGVGFQSADQLAERLGIDRASPLRARAALKYILHTLSEEGHVGFPGDDVIERTTALTGINRCTVEEAVEHQCRQGDLVREPWRDSESMPTAPAWLYLKPLFLAELGVGRAILELGQGPHPLLAIDVERALAWVEHKMGLELAPTQRAAIQQAATQKLLVITGGPGVGKTTIVHGILEIFTAKGLRCTLCAPTGRAAKRLAETTGRAASTIHRLLEFNPHQNGFVKNRDNLLELDLLIVDEASMVDVVLMNQLLRAVPAQACVVLVGDVDQLPSVGPGTVLADLIASDVVPVTRLTEIFRQAGNSGIVRAAHAVNHGELPNSTATGSPGDFYVIEADTPEAVLQKIATVVRERIPARFGIAPLDIQVLTPMNRSELGARNLNVRLQEILNPPKAGAEGMEVQGFGWTFRVGDKVMQTCNDYQKEVFNGDLGRIDAINSDEQQLVVRFEDRCVSYDFGELDELMLAYATTIHKAQGAEYPAVVIALHTQHFLMLQRNLLYTAITRGKKLVIVVGNPRALQQAAGREDTAQRLSGLRWRLTRQ